MVQKRVLMARVSGLDKETIAMIEALIKERNEWKLKASKLVERYELPGVPEARYGVMLCPNCGKRVKPKHNRCHICGKLLTWRKESELT